MTISPRQTESSPSPRRLAFPVLALATVAITACGANTVDAGKVERMLQGRTPQGSGAHVVNARCPSSLDATVGASFDCTVRLSDDTAGLWRVQIVGSDGRVSVSNADFDPSAPIPGPSAVGQTKLLEAPGGVKLNVTLLSYEARIDESSGHPESHIAAVVLKISNLGPSPYRDDKPGRLSALRLDNGNLGTPPHRVERAPCGGSFYRTPVTLAPGATMQGCIPYEVPNDATAHFFSFAPSGGTAVNWSLG